MRNDIFASQVVRFQLKDDLGHRIWHVARESTLGHLEDFEVGQPR